MNIIKLVKKMGFDYKGIRDKYEREEIIYLLELFLRDYNFYGNIFEEKLYVKNSYAVQGYNLEYMLDSIVNRKARLIPILDDQLACTIISAYKNNIEYNLRLIYNKDSNEYILALKPTIEELSLDHYDFGDNFEIIYSLETGKLSATRMIKNVDNTFLSEEYNYSINKCDNIVLVYNISEYNLEKPIIDCVNVEQKKIVISSSRNNNVSKPILYAEMYDVYDRKFILNNFYNFSKYRKFKDINNNVPLALIANKITTSNRQTHNKKIKIK